jgi:hypothetical protein
VKIELWDQSSNLATEGATVYNRRGGKVQCISCACSRHFDEFRKEYSKFDICIAVTGDICKPSADCGGQVKYGSDDGSLDRKSL